MTLDQLLADTVERVARAEKATEGPWICDFEAHGAPFGEETLIQAPAAKNVNKQWVIATIYYDGLHIGCTKPDATFIAAARTDIPIMAGQIRELVKRLKDAEETVEFYAFHQTWQDQGTKAVRCLARLRAPIGEAK